MSREPQRKLLLVGWDAADWKVIGPMLDAGKMPHLESLINRGVMGNLATLYPVLSPMLWTSIATGKRAWKHGVHGFSEPDPQSGGVRPISNLGRKCKAVWNILNQNGLRSNVVGWWPSHPAEPIRGVMVSNQFKQVSTGLEEPWVRAPGAMHPIEFQEPLSKLRIHPHELEGDQLLPFVPRAAEINQEQDSRLLAVARSLAECSSIQAAATAVMQHQPWDFMAVYYDAIDHFSHGFMRYHPPKLPWINDHDFELYQHVIEGAYQFHDMMLGTLLYLAGPETTVLVLSDHGFHPDHLRPKSLPNEPAGPAEEHRPFGMFVMAGPGIRQDELIFGANLLDITPTILHLFDLPVGRDMDGAPLLTAWESPPDVKLIDSWETVPGEDGQHPPDMQLSPVDNHHAMQQLVDLGYIEKPDEDKQVAISSALREQRYNLARAYQGGGRIPEALELFEQLWQESPAEHRFGVKVFHCRLKLNQTVEARAVLQKLHANKKLAAQRAMKELKKVEDRLKTEGKQRADSKPGALLYLQQLQRQATTNEGTFHYFRGLLLHAEGHYASALSEFELAGEVESHHRPDVHCAKGEAYLALRRWKQAFREFEALLDLDSVNPSGHLGLAKSLLPQRKFKDALSHATAAAGLFYHQPQAHFLAGLALARLGRYQEARDSMLQAVSQNPVFPQAHRRLSRLYDGPLGNPDKAEEHRLLEASAKQRLADYRAGKPLPARHQAMLSLHDFSTLGTNLAIEFPTNLPEKNSIVVVSGLPRSGTSMMMQMLAAGGYPLLIDQSRPADDGNRLGYFELESVKGLARDSSWLPQAEGKAIKVIAQLLPHLPEGRPYRIVFMERPLAEIIQSQFSLLEKLGRAGGQLSSDELAQTYQRQLSVVQGILNDRPGEFYLLPIRYAEALNNPHQTAARINQFLGAISTKPP